MKKNLFFITILSSLLFSVEASAMRMRVAKTLLASVFIATEQEVETQAPRRHILEISSSSDIDSDIDRVKPSYQPPPTYQDQYQDKRPTQFQQPQYQHIKSQQRSHGQTPTNLVKFKVIRSIGEWKWFNWIATIQEILDVTDMCDYIAKECYIILGNLNYEPNLTSDSSFIEPACGYTDGYYYQYQTSTLPFVSYASKEELCKVLNICIQLKNNASSILCK